MVPVQDIVLFNPWGLATSDASASPSGIAASFSISYSFWKGRTYFPALQRQLLRLGDMGGAGV